MWDLGSATSFAHTGTGYGWWIARGDTMGQHSKVLGGGDPGGPDLPHHFQCGGRHSGASLDIVGVRRCGRSVRLGKVGATSRRLFLSE